jgi:hypothetical protein
MKKTILFFSIFLISLIIGCSDELPVNVSTNTGVEDLTGLGTQYAHLTRIKISQYDNELDRDSVLVNTYSKFPEMTGTRFVGDFVNFKLLNTTYDLVMEVTTIWSIPNHGHTNTNEADFYIQKKLGADTITLIKDSLDIPDIPIDSRGFRNKTVTHSVNGMSTDTLYMTHFELGSHLNGPPFQIVFKVDLKEGDDIITPLFREAPFFEYWDYFTTPESSKPMMYFHTKDNMNPSNYTIEMDTIYFLANKYYGSRYYTNYSERIKIYEIINDIATLKHTVEHSLAYINFTGKSDYQGYSIKDTTFTFDPEKQYGIIMSVARTSK